MFLLTPTAEFSTKVQTSAAQQMCKWVSELGAKGQALAPESQVFNWEGAGQHERQPLIAVSISLHLMPPTRVGFLLLLNTVQHEILHILELDCLDEDFMELKVQAPDFCGVLGDVNVNHSSAAFPK